MSGPHPLLRALASLAAATAAACGGGGEPISGVIHLDLRLGNGGSPAAALAGALPALAIAPDAADPASLGAWRVAGGRPAAAPRGGVRLVAEAPDAEPPEFVLERELEAARYPTLELLLEARGNTDVRVAWSGDGGDGEMTLPLGSSERTLRLRFPLGDSREWRGTVRALRVAPTLDVGMPVAVHAVRLLPDGFVWGHEPLDEERSAGDAGGEHGDAGLRAAGRIERRAWPADLDVPLYAQVERVPRGAVLATSVAGHSTLDVDVLYVAVDGRTDGGAWRVLTELEVPARSNRWQPVTADLADHGGAALELRFRAHRSRPEAPPGDGAVAPRLEHVLWGAPEVVGEPPASRRPNLVLVTLDTTRADALATGNAAFAPFLARLAGEAVVFTDAWAACNATSPSHASLLTGLHVEEHGVISNRHLLAPELATLPEMLRAAGYHTAAAVSVPHIQSGAGFGQGFDEFAPAVPGAEVDGALAIGAVEHMVAEWRELPARPFFLWVHLFDPHTPYSPPEAFVQEFLARTGLEHPPRKADPPTVPVYFDDRRTLEEIPPASRWHAGVTSIESLRFSYHLGVAYADHLCERLVDALAAADALDDTALLLTADHGESLGEHGIWFDHQGLFRETLHVPLYLRLPGAALAGERVGTRVTGVDVAPTLLALAGLRPRADLSGADLAALARKAGGAAEDRRVFFAFSDMHQVGFHDGEAHFFTTLTDRLRYGTSLVVTDGRTVPHKADPIPRDKHFLYDPAADPALTRDVSAERPGETAAAHAELERWRASLDRKQSTRREVSADEEEGLRKMGYTGD